MCILDSVPKRAKVCQSVPTARESSPGELEVTMKNKVIVFKQFQSLHFRQCTKVCQCVPTARESSLGDLEVTIKNKDILFKQFQIVHL